MANLTPVEKAHLDQFMQNRPDWAVLVTQTRFTDEHVGPKANHSYDTAHPYVSGLRYTLQAVLAYKPEKILDIGSPLAQIAAMAVMSPKVTVLDIRNYPDPAELGVRWITSNASRMPFEDDSQEFITSCWVMCHVGDGRYGDPLDPDGDVKMLREIQRITKPGGKIVLGFGQLQECPALLFNSHRIYSWSWLEKIFEEVGLEIIDRKELPVASDLFSDATWGERKGSQIVHAKGKPGMYGICTLKKK